ncbi:hypothetical protein ABRY23_05840 [Melioribacteraceae bacterium 4301-Me]|uniref:hypothetical protein n=1 Tax=Pyranulibacter aquaticus TaxID=3163344 RepID=UPI003599CD0A
MSKIEQKKKPKRSLFRKIVNTFIGLFAFICLLIILFLGYSQTNSFREFLREKIIAAANSSLNGQINIEKIDGTIFTSFYLRKVSVTVSKDTLLYAKKIEIKTSPLQLLLKKIFFRKILLEDANINLLQDSTGTWNFDKLLKSKAADTTKSQFNFAIQASNLQLRNVNFVRQTFQNKYSKKIYKLINLDDLQIKNLFLSAEIYLDISNSNYLVDLRELSFSPNLEKFNVKELSGQIALTHEYILVNRLKVISDKSSIFITARLDSLNLFSNVELKDFQKYPISINLTASPFSFDDLSSFIESTELLKGNVDLQLKAKGEFGNFNIEDLKVDFRNTHVQMTGNIQNLNEPEKLFLTSSIKNSNIDYKDINLLLPSLKLPRFDELTLQNINVEFNGEPLNFSTKFTANSSEGKISSTAQLNFKNKLTAYNISFETEDFNLMPILGIKSKINSKGKIIGKGISPLNLNSTLEFFAENSSINSHKIDYIAISSTAKNKMINIKLSGKSEKNIANINGNLQFDKDTSATYNFSGDIRNLNLASYLNDTRYLSNLNFFFNAKGRSFDPDKINITFEAGIDSSYFENTNIDYSKIRLVVNTDSTNKQIKFVSDFLDFDIYGNFSTKKAISLLQFEANSISNIVSKKLEEMNPIHLRNDTIKDTVSIQNDAAAIQEDLKFNFDFKFKDFKLIAKLLNNDKLDVEGSGSGSIENLNNNFSINTQLSLNYLIFLNKQKTIYISGLDADFNFTRDNRFSTFDNIFGSISLTAKRFYSNTNIREIEADFVFNQSKLFFNVSANIDSTNNIAAEGTLLISPIEQSINFDKILIDFNNVSWVNKNTPKIFFSSDHMRFENFTLRNGVTTVNINGKIVGDNFQDLTLAVDSITGSILNNYLMNSNQNELSTNGNLTASLNGNFEKPEIDLRLVLKDISYSNVKFGNLIGQFIYKDKTVSTDLRFIDTTYNYNNPKLSIIGTIPINLSFINVKNRFSETDQINLSIKSENFDISTFGNVIPYVISQKGKLIADVKIGGTFYNPDYSGILGIQDGSFRSLINYLDYSFSTRLKFHKQTLTIDSLKIANSGGSKYNGEINGTGEIRFKGFSLDKVDVSLRGLLAVLGQRSKTVSPLLYGDLLIGTSGDWKFQLLNNRAYFTGNILLKQTDLVYTTTDETYYKNNSNFDVRIIEDTTKIDKELLRFQNLLKTEKILRKNKKIVSTAESLFDYNIKVKVENSAKIIFILSQAVNQRLAVEIAGELELQSISGIKRAQGSFELLPGSKLEFFKTFDAKGYLRFESNIYNPYLDVIATYTSDYVNPRDPNAPAEEVAVKIKIKGTLEDLGKNLANNPESIGVYVGSNNIQHDIRDPQYDYADAFSFILIGKFKDDLTAQDKGQVAAQTNTLGNTATSFLGSVLTNFVNSAVGDLVNNISFSQSGEYTRFSLSGRIQNLRYSFGGTTELFQNFAKANLKIEYLFNPHFLIRVERRDPIGQTYTFDEKINELGFKYRFEF